MTTAPIDLPVLDDGQDDAPDTTTLRLVVDEAPAAKAAALAEDLEAALAGDGLLVLIDEVAALGTPEPVFDTLCRQIGVPDLYRHGIPGLLVLDEAPTPQENVR